LLQEVQAVSYVHLNNRSMKASFGESVDDIAIVLWHRECRWFQAC
jgi:hypothetical protein